MASRRSRTRPNKRAPVPDFEDLPDVATTKER